MSEPTRSGSRAPLVALAVAVLLVAAAGLGFVHLRNQLVALDVAVDTQWKQVENQLVRQYELLPKLVRVANRYAGHEKEILDNLFQARARYAEASQQEKPAIAGDVDGILARALALSESYPDLKADRSFRDLSYEIAGTKNRISLERKRYNELVGAFNMRLRQVPWRFASSGLEPRLYFEADEASLREPELEI